MSKKYILNTDSPSEITFDEESDESTKQDIEELDFNHMKLFFEKMSYPIEKIYKKYFIKYSYFGFLSKDVYEEKYDELLNIIYNNIEIKQYIHNN
mgnify:CR=1 FL=1